MVLIDCLAYTQYLNTVEEFRNAIIALSRLELDIPAKDALPRVGGRLLSQGELVRAKDCKAS